MSVTAKRFHTGSHWGLYDAEVEDGVLVGIQPFANDPQPTPMVNALPSAVYHESRITQPMVRKGFLAQGVESDRTGRGVEPFVPVSWDEALDLIAASCNGSKTSMATRPFTRVPAGPVRASFTMPSRNCFAL